MKILLVGNYENDQQRSMLGFAQALESGLKEKGLDVRLISPRSVLGHFFSSRLIPANLKKWLGYIDKFVIFPRTIRSALSWADVVHICDHSNSFYVRYLRKTPHVVTCHDLLAIQSAQGEFDNWKTGITGKIFQWIILDGLKKAGYIVCVSENTQNELERIAGISRRKTMVVYNGFYQPYAVMPHEQRIAALHQIGISPEQEFLLHVGGNQFYKNRIGVLKIFHALRQQYPKNPIRLIMAGKAWTDEMRKYVILHKLDDEVLELNNLSHEHLRALYSQAKALIFPSLYEGFGLPIIEAQACGTLVFTSNRAPMNEVGGNAAIYFDPLQPENAVQVIQEYLQSPEKIQDMVGRGFENIERFSPDMMIDKYLDVYSQLSRPRLT